MWGRYKRRLCGGFSLQLAYAESHLEMYNTYVAYHDMARSMLSYFERTWSESNVVFRTSRRGHRSWYVSFEAFEHEFGHEYLELASNLTNVICSEPHVAA